MPQMTKEAYFAFHRGVRDTLLRRSTVLLARDLDERRFIHGYALFEPGNTLHWAFVKQASRTQGVFFDLIRECLTMTDAPSLRYTHPPASRMFERKLLEIGFTKGGLPRC